LWQNWISWPWYECHDTIKIISAAYFLHFMMWYWQKHSLILVPDTSVEVFCYC
jgi:hypothetical protein